MSVGTIVFHAVCFIGAAALISVKCPISRWLLIAALMFFQVAGVHFLIRRAIRAKFSAVVRRAAQKHSH